jgi:hypothetical protein
MKTPSVWTRWTASTDAAGPLALPLQLTAILLLLRPMGPEWVRALLLVVAGLALLFRPVLLSPFAWWLAAALVAARIAADWPLSDNHIYLLGYWCVAAGLAVGARDRAVTLARSAAWLLGLAMVFAVLWKGLLSPDYLDGRFFRVTMLTDDRFADAVRLIGGLTNEQIDANRDVLAPLPDGAELADPPSLIEPASFRAFVVATTWGVLVVEACIAALFLWPVGRRLQPARHALLLAFCLVTYAFAPVAGFGWLLIAMGIATCRADQHGWRLAYLATWFVVLLYSEIPWAAHLADWWQAPA